MKASRILQCLVMLAVTTAGMAGDGTIIRHRHAIHDEYIVVLRDEVLPEHVPDVARSLARTHKGKLHRVWRDALKGFSVEMTEARALALSHHPQVKYVEQNAEMFLSGTPVTIATKIDPATCGPTGQNCAPTTDNRLWHLDRLSQSWASRDGSNTSCFDGSNVTIYVVDTGVKATHKEFLRDDGTSRVQTGYDASTDYKDGGVEYYPANDPCRGWAGDRMPEPFTAGDIEGQNRYDLDLVRFNQEVGGNGHGTAVASIAAGRYSGVAKNATIVPVKIAPCGRNAARSMKRSHTYSKGTTAFWIDRSGSTWKPGGYYVATTSGTTAASEPVWTTGTVADGSVQWQFLPAPSGNVNVEQQIEGLDWIRRQTVYAKSPAVITMSTYQLAATTGVDEAVGPLSLSLEDAVRALSAPASGTAMTFVASANNQGRNACDTSPARMSQELQAKVITAGGSMVVNVPDPVGSDVPVGEQANGDVNLLEPAYDSSAPTGDARWICGAGDSAKCTALRSNGTITIQDTAGSNGGPCVTLFAPAKNMNLASNTAANGYRDPRRTTGSPASGTSWSAPHVAGVIARILQANPGYTQQQVYDTLMANALHGVLDSDSLNPPNVTGTPNILVNLSDVSITTQPQDAYASASSPATLSVTATGMAGVTYQWYEANAAFDLTKRRGATSSTLIPGATGATLTGLNPSSAKGYWVRVTSACAQVESDIAVVTPQPLTAPQNVVATGAGASVTITWNVVADANGYKVESRTGSGGWQQAALVSGGSQTSAAHTPSSTSGVVLYRVRATLDTFESEASNNDVAFVGTFSGDAIVKAAHIVEVRNAVNGLAQLAGVTPPYSGAALDTVTVQTQLITANDFTSLLSHLNAVRGDADLALPVVSFSPAVADGALIADAHMATLRGGVQ